MTATPISDRLFHVLLEQTARTRGSSRTEESESKITSVDAQIAALVELREHERHVLTALHSLIAPRILPVELLVAILVLAVEQTPGPVAHRISHFKKAFRISHVYTHFFMSSSQLQA